MFGKLFKPREHYVFDYKPRYYDERKERLQQLEDKYKQHKNSDEDTPTIRLTKNNLKNNWVKNKRSATDKSTNLRLAIIIAILVGIVAYIFELHKLF
ncbi:hypothetical protein [Lutibacter maritimus]|jgi:hypothetical protein|uniref:Uncharacterized protein n=1 Tax=Lutibacter maritimus TaxID=593133 RepID=A0A1I6SJM8_9FLAO|nr:hypothetical protein [Lutibacter maritimus]SFS77152.1 hypothetical protein SAMN04488006_3103 [Lutibacter maritimus]